MGDKLAPYSRAVSGIRELIAVGRVAPGANLLVSDIARALDLSATPVREALARLAGEGLIEDRRGKGYFVWPLGAADVSELYQTHHAYLRIALEFGASFGAGPGAWRVAPILGIATAIAIFDQIVEGGGNRILREDFRQLTERMVRLRLVEAIVLADLDGEADALRDGLRSDDPADLANVLLDYHERRLKWAGAIARTINQDQYR